MSQEVTTLSSRIVYQNRWMKVREDQIQRASGQQGIYGVVEKADFAVIAAVENGMIWLVQQYRYPVAQRFWELPQGAWEHSTVSPLALAKAELREETGVVAASMQHIAHLFLAYGFSTQGYDIFLASELSRGDTELDIEEEGLIAKAFPIAQVTEMILHQEIKDASTIAAFGLLKLRGIL